jgi:hypothetical protein
MTSPRIRNHGDAVDLLLDGLGKFSQADRDTNPRHADRQSAQASLLADQYERPLRFVAFNTVKGWVRDVTAEIAREVLALPDQDFSPAVVERAG